MTKAELSRPVGNTLRHWAVLGYGRTRVCCFADMPVAEQAVMKRGGMTEKMNRHEADVLPSKHFVSSLSKSPLPFSTIITKIIGLERRLCCGLGC